MNRFFRGILVADASVDIDILFYFDGAEECRRFGSSPGGLNNCANYFGSIYTCCYGCLDTGCRRRSAFEGVYCKLAKSSIKGEKVYVRRAGPVPPNQGLRPLLPPSAPVARRGLGLWTLVVLTFMTECRGIRSKITPRPVYYPLWK